MINRYSHILIIRVCVTLLVLNIPAVLAQTGNTASALEDNQGVQRLEEVVVTARKIEETLQDVPIAVTALDGTTIEQSGLTNIRDLTNFVPNLSSTTSLGGGNTNVQFFIRGIGQFDFISTADQSVGVYLDGVYVARSIGAALDIVDIDRIEVLRGPQGTLFGRNSVAGAVQMITAPPGEEFKGSAEFITGSRDKIDVKVMSEFPIIKGQLSSKLSFATLNRDGYGTRLLDDSEAGDIERMAGRGELYWTPSEDLTFRLIGDYSRSKEGGSTEQMIAYEPGVPGFFSFVPYNEWLNSVGLPPIDERWVTGDVDKSFVGEKNISEYEIWGLSLTGTWDISSDLSIKSVTAYRNMQSNTAFDIDGTPYPVLEQDIDLDHRQFSQEIQLIGNGFDNRLNWLAGYFYFFEEADDNELIPIMQKVVPTGLGRVGAGLKEFRSISPPFLFYAGPETKSWAVFAQGTWSFTENLSTTMGIRYTDEKKEFENSMSGSAFLGAADGFFDVPFFRALNTQKKSWTDVSPRVGLEYRLNDDAMIYAAYSQGFRSGAFNGRDFAPLPITVEPEEVAAYEAGLKSTWFDNRFRLNMAGFFYEYDNFQNLALGAGGPENRNIADFEVWGFEIESSAFLIKNLELNASLGYQDSKAVKVITAALFNDNTVLTGAPTWSGLASASYMIPIKDFGKVVVRGDYAYKDSFEFLFPNLPNEGEDGYHTFNARLSFTPVSDKWELQVYGLNLSDSRYKLMGENGSAFGFGFTTASWSPPREWGVKVKVHF
jgi:iron complex outermembrane recepter protein